MSEKDIHDKFLHEENKKREVIAPDGSIIEIDPLQDYFCDARPQVSEPYKVKVVEKFS